ncbi:DUF4279 domain-containing protein [Hahella sp. HN01]|uniref:DUF4279 domain-containing protein n=1 Tax=Hahella sp. HN01 TaxID=2847262 RepID=UPI001C1EBF56|nr:DUF4279 domain-containing protein [Hahella sp. HN01]MBU6954006.1 DUF4279 domain-containing protein [Hahella sp. HN01]
MEEGYYFCYMVSLRIIGDIEHFDEITKVVGVKPTYSHKKGDKRSPRSKPFERDVWIYKPEIDEHKPLAEHLDSLWATVSANVENIKALKEKLKVDIFCGYRSDCDHAGFDVPYQSLTIFQALEVPFSVSVIVIRPD